MKIGSKQIGKTNCSFKVCMCLLLCGLISCGNKKLENDLSKNNIKGKVKTIFEESYDCEMILDKPTKTSLDEKITYEYNKDGNQLSGVSVNSLGMVESKISLIYNSANQKIEEQYYRIDRLDTSITIDNYFYNQKKLLERTESRSKTYVNTYVYEYDNSDKLIVIKNHTMVKPYSPSLGDFTPKFENTFDIIKNKYNQNGLLSRKERYNDNTQNPTRIQEYTTYEYDDNANLVTETHFDNADQIFRKISFKYVDNKKVQEEDILKSYSVISHFDNYGNLTLKSIIGSPEQTEYNEYSYDSETNWIRKVKFNNFKKPIFITERKIVYY
jgi:hypothetical protein